MTKNRDDILNDQEKKADSPTLEEKERDLAGGMDMESQEEQRSQDLASLVGLGSRDKTKKRVDDSGRKKRLPVDRRSPQRQVDHKPAHKLWMDAPDRYPPVLESLRLIKNTFLKLKDEEGDKVFLLTGSDRKVGVSTLATNLGLVLARDLLDQHILLVDANISNPSLHSTFGLPQEPGLMDYLLKDYTLLETAVTSHLPNLDLIPLGEIDVQVTSPFDLNRFTEFIEEANQNYDFILFDSSPALHSSHCRTLSVKVDGVVSIAEANVTRWEVLLELKKQLERDGAKLVGGVLNKRRFVIPKWVYKFF